MGLEIERRFYIKNIQKISEITEKYKDTKKTIIQDYIYSDMLTAIRKRKIIKNNMVKYIYTVKTGRKLIAVNEFEEEITKEQYDSIKTDPSRITIEKDRYVIPYKDGLNIELDIFHGVYEGVIFAEIEFKSEEQAKNTPIPEWFDVEIGNIISNNKMSKGIESVEKYIKQNI
ncbi:MAG: hypothetical protein IJH12_09630 [Clostridia bacterium]|nr:hypothetical protein [Clostridia bacterium]